MTAALEVQGLGGGYEDFDVVSGIALTVGADEKVGLFGPNGHGKTTILNAISGTLARRQGSVRFFGQSIERARPQDIVAAGLVHVPQANTVFPDMEIQETLELAAWTPRARLSRPENLERALTIFPRLAERRRQLARTLSGGERQMLSIGVGVMCAPRMLMLDEPTLGLSPKLKDELAQAISMISAGGIPLLVVEQDVAFVLSLVDRMYFVDHGAITREIGSRDTVDHDEIMSMYFGSGENGMSADAIATVLVSGLVMGSVYALIASGLSLVWSTLGIFNFAHGALMTLGAYLAWTLTDARALGLSPWVALSVAVIVVAGVGVLLERLLIRPFYGHRAMLLITVMTTLAATVFLSKGIQLIWGPRLKQLPALVPGNVSLLGTSISAQEALIVAVAPIVLGLLWAFLRFSSTGRGIRAVGQNPQAAQLIGIDVARLFAITFALAAALAALTGILIGSVRLVTPALGDEPLIKALIIVIFGGLGSIFGTIWAAYLIGLAEAVLVFTIGIYWAPSTLFLLLILVLLLRPQGLMGRVVR